MVVFGTNSLACAEDIMSGIIDAVGELGLNTLKSIFGEFKFAVIYGIWDEILILMFPFIRLFTILSKLISASIFFKSPFIWASNVVSGKSKFPDGLYILLLNLL